MITDQDQDQDRPAPHAIAVSARTVIEGCFSPAGTAELATVYDLGLAVGLSEQTVRLTIRRMQAVGELRQLGRGRAGTLERTVSGAERVRLEARLLAFAFAHDAGSAPWDGLWHIHAFTVPEARRAERDALRGALTTLGAAQLVPGVYVSPHELRPELEHMVTPELVAEFLMTATSAALEVPGCADARAIAERLWPAAPTVAAYAELEAVLASPDPGTDRPIDVAARALMLAEGLDRALAQDPLLPPELRTAPWPPVAARAAFLGEWQALESRAPDFPVFAAYDTE
ncbi:PaaX family transcriptional regulator [Leucobacter chromiireducens]|uniref:PaaX family transcriptional regulator n=1 Tax=Leucobacter chromiireducens subsp. chromiireducens TaxID=660067 RepID=A0ABS1SLB0_9MICO|nr:PaaX family transcriptional regulator [Leucobacter chromiireducens]MBL3688972.1 PaaX family transcriptional regulator [Leucobacter chromiireducens subsp. chromiireducens]